MSELEKTIEELEAEVIAELEEAHDEVVDLGAPGGQKDAGKSVSKSKDPAANVAGTEKSETVPGEKKDLGGLDGQDEKVDKAKDKKADSSDQSEHETGKKATAAAKTVSGNAPQKGAKPAEKMPKALAAGDELDHDGDELAENKKLTKAQQIEAIGKMKKADIEEMIANHQAKLSEAENAESEAELKKLEDAKAEIEEKIKSISVKEDVEALVAGEDLSEEFKEKAATIFEAAVKSKVRDEIERITGESKTNKDEEIETFKDELTEKVDTYLNYVVDEWTKENELAIERGLKGEIAEDFISGLKQLFEDHYIDVPDEKYDVLEAQSEKISELEGKLNEAIQKNVSFKDSNSKLVREQVISDVSEDLADTEIEKFKSLTNDIDFTDEESFREKLDTLKDSYFPKIVADDTYDDENGGTAQDVDTTDTMKKYLSAISRDQKASA